MANRNFEEEVTPKPTTAQRAPKTKKLIPPKKLKVTEQKLLATKCELHTAKAALATAEETLRVKPTTTVPPPHAKDAVARLLETQKKLKEAENELDAAVLEAKIKLEAAERKFINYKAYSASLIDKFQNDVLELHRTTKNLTAQKNLEAQKAETERRRADGLVVELDAMMRKLEVETKACEGKAECVSCVTHLRTALKVSQAHEDAAGKKLDEMWVASLRTMEMAAMEKSGYAEHVAAVEGEGREESENDDEKGEKTAASSDESGDGEDEDEDEDEDGTNEDTQSEFDIITGC